MTSGTVAVTLRVLAVGAAVRMRGEPLASVSVIVVAVVLVLLSIS